MPKKSVTIVCAVLLISTILIVGLLYRSNLNEATDLLAQYNKNTQQFDRTDVNTVVEDLSKLPDDGETVKPGTGVDIPFIPGIPDDDNGVNPYTLEELIMMPDKDFWLFATNNNFAGKVKENFSQHEKTLNDLKAVKSVTITAPVWQWGSSGYDKVSTQINITCNSAIAPLVEAAMNDIYNHSSQPVMYYDGCYVIRKVTNGDSPSAHAYGCALDFNANANVGDYGNGYGKKVATEAQWNALAESKAKYQMFYIDSPVVCIFKSYGFTWGGDYSSNKDGMHFSFIGDYTRDKGQENYNAYKNRRN